MLLLYSQEEDKIGHEIKILYIFSVNVPQIMHRELHSGLGGWCLLNFHETGLKIVGNAKKHIV